MKKIFCIIFIFAVLESYCQKEIPEQRHIEVSREYLLAEINFKELEIIDIKQEETNDLRRLYFIHGLGGDGSSWSKVPDACANPHLNIRDFPARKVYTSTPSYSDNTEASLHFVAQQVTDKIRDINLSDVFFDSMDPSKAILIGHSQGSLVCRTMIHIGLGSDIKQFGGFISVAGPLGGATILNNRHIILSLADNACNSLSAGPAEKKSFINGIFKFFLGDSYINSACESVTHNMLPIFFSKYYDEVTNDYLVGAKWLDTLQTDLDNQRYREMPKITFYCVEPRDKLFWRTLEWLQKDPNTAGYFGANSDFTFYENSIMPIYNHYYAERQTAINDLAWLKQNKWWIYLSGKLTWPPISGIVTYELLYDEYFRRQNEYNKGVEWFDQVNGEWEVVIGAKEYIPQTETRYNCTRCTRFGPPNKYGDRIEISFNVGITQNRTLCESYDCSSIETVQYTSHTIKYHESDGVVTAPSAIDLPYQTRLPIRVYPREFENVIDKGSSHMQVRNDDGIKEHLNKALNGNYGDFFRTERNNE